MEASTPQSSSSKKRPIADRSNERWRKRPSPVGRKRDDDDYDFIIRKNAYEFRVLLPNGTCVYLKIRPIGGEMPLSEFVNHVKDVFSQTSVSGPSKQKTFINWKFQDLHFVDVDEHEIKGPIVFNKFEPNKCHILRLNDGSGEAGTYANMWDLTPDTDLLTELSEVYNFETALADLIDNSLQAVWCNRSNQRRLISVGIDESRIEIFDTGPGMDGSHENSIAKWGKMGSSLNRLAKGQAIGGKPPYLKPCFGMFGYGGPVASMHLGRRALVSSKTQKSKKVYWLVMEREALLSSSSEQTWKTMGGLRDPLESEIEKATHGSFTKVEIFEPKLRCLNIWQLQCRLKDIYFPYIQCDEVSETGRTVMPIKFEVNGTDLAEIVSGEVAVTNLQSCNGQPFTFQLHFTQETFFPDLPGFRTSSEANAHLKCVYFPIIQGKESIDKILENLQANGCGITEDYKNFSRVSVRRLGRLLPEARWAWIPFMEPKQRKGGRGDILKRCCFRVKCFIDTDSGFSPTPPKTDLAQHHIFTIALKNFGQKSLEKERDVHIKIVKDGEELNLLQLEKQYHKWISQMHDYYDEEIDSGDDEARLVIDPSNKKELGISSDVVRIHEHFRRKGAVWRSGQRIKVLKGACTGFHKTNVYATLEYIVVEGLKGDVGGEARLICRPIDVPVDSGCLLADNNGNTSIEIRRSISLPISVIDTGKCVTVEDTVWDNECEKRSQKVPSSIDVLSRKDSQDLGIKGELPHGVVDAGYDPPEQIVAVVRPASFDAATTSKSLKQKYILEGNFEMTLEIKLRGENKSNKNVKKIFSGPITPASQNGFHGLYIFSPRRELPKLFQEAGLYTFLFSLKELSCKTFEKRVRVRALSEVGSWKLLWDKPIPRFSTRVGSCFPPFSIGCCDKYTNRIPFPCNTKVNVKLSSCGGFTAHLNNLKQYISSDNFSVTIKDMEIESSELDKIRPGYEATLLIFSHDELFSVAIPCEVMPGGPQNVSICPANFGKELLPGQIIKDLVLKMTDVYGNLVKENESIILKADGFCIQDKRGSAFKVDHNGHVNLSGVLKVVEGYGKKVSFSVLSSDHMIFKEEFQIERRELRAAFEVPVLCAAGTQLENLVFEVINSGGEVDQTIHNDDKSSQSHTLTITSDSLNIDDSLRYSFCHGRCGIRAISLPENKGVFFFEATHSRHPELHFRIEVHVEQTLDLGHKNIPISEGMNLLTQDSSAVDRRNFMLPDSSMPSDLRSSVKCEMDDLKELENDIREYGLCIKGHETNMESLIRQQSKIEKEISNLQVDLDVYYTQDLESTSEKEVVVEKIASKSDSAASVICRLFQSSIHKEQGNNFANNILGVVAFLGTVQTKDLSRIFAQYLGEDQMLAIICKSYTDSANLEKCESNGQVNSACPLHSLAAELEICINKHYNVICLENIRPYTGALGSEPHRKLALPDPTLPNGKRPPGYLGYAVNMIDMDVYHSHLRTTTDHGLRETLFYRLFGDLQVYENRQDMYFASSCIKEGAVSLDGGIMRGNGVVTLGYWEPDIRFPVVSLESQSHFSPHLVDILKKIEEKKQELREILEQLKSEQKSHTRVVKKFRRKYDAYKNILEQKINLLPDSAVKLETMDDPA